MNEFNANNRNPANPPIYPNPIYPNYQYPNNPYPNRNFYQENRNRVNYQAPNLMENRFNYNFTPPDFNRPFHNNPYRVTNFNPNSQNYHPHPAQFYNPYNSQNPRNQPYDQVINYRVQNVSNRYFYASTNSYNKMSNSQTTNNIMSKTPSPKINLINKIPNTQITNVQMSKTQISNVHITNYNITPVVIPAVEVPTYVSVPTVSGYNNNIENEPPTMVNKLETNGFIKDDEKSQDSFGSDVIVLDDNQNDNYSSYLMNRIKSLNLPSGHVLEGDVELPQSNMDDEDSIFRMTRFQNGLQEYIDYNRELLNQKTVCLSNIKNYMKDEDFSRLNIQAKIHISDEIFHETLTKLKAVHKSLTEMYTFE